jgi:hypothetical protein
MRFGILDGRVVGRLRLAGHRREVPMQTSEETACVGTPTV